MKDLRIQRATDSLNRFAVVMEAAKLEAIAADPGLLPHLERARKIAPDIGWLDIAAFRENRTRSTPKAVRDTAEDPRRALMVEYLAFRKGNHDE